jgi:hypothetical protein
MSAYNFTIDHRPSIGLERLSRMLTTIRDTLSSSLQEQMKNPRFW